MKIFISIAGLVIAVLGLVFGILAWIAPFDTIGPSPLDTGEEQRPTRAVDSSAAQEEPTKVVKIEVTRLVEVTLPPPTLDIEPTLPPSTLAVEPTLPQPTRAPAAVQEPELHKVTISKPSASNWDSFKSIWSKTKFQDMDEPGTRTYNVPVIPSETLRWSFAWCAKNASYLQDILTPLSKTMLIDGVSLDSSQVLQHDLTSSDGWACRYWSTLLSDWERGATVELEVDYRIAEEFFDGAGVYQEGRYHQIIFADVN